MYVTALVLSERTWYVLQPSVFRCTGVVGRSDEVECVWLINLTVLWEVGVIGSINEVEFSGIHQLVNSIDVLGETDVVDRIFEVESTGLDLLEEVINVLCDTDDVDCISEVESVKKPF